MGQRRRAREAALQRLYQVELAGDAGPEAAASYWDGAGSRQADARDFAEALVQTALEHREKIDQCIDVAAVNWQLGRISRIDLCVLRLAVCELLWFRETPANVVINEAIEIARKFSDEEAPSFVNGVLDRVARGSGVIGDSGE